MCFASSLRWILGLYPFYPRSWVKYGRSLIQTDIDDMLWLLTIEYNQYYKNMGKEKKKKSILKEPKKDSILDRLKFMQKDSSSPKR